MQQFRCVLFNDVVWLTVESETAKGGTENAICLKGTSVLCDYTLNTISSLLSALLYLCLPLPLILLPLAAFLTQTVNLDDTTVKFEIWDTAGQERYHSLAPMYYRGAQAAIVVYDITNQVSVSGGEGRGRGRGASLGSSNYCVRLGKVRRDVQRVC